MRTASVSDSNIFICDNLPFEDVVYQFNGRAGLVVGRPNPHIQTATAAVCSRKDATSLARAGRRVSVTSIRLAQHSRGGTKAGLIATATTAE